VIGGSKVRVKAPVISYESAKAMIDIGVSEIYLGANASNLNNISYTGRGNSNHCNSQISIGFDELDEIVKLAHANDVKVTYLANLPQFTIPGESRDKIEKSFMEYIDIGLRANVDGIVLADIGQLLYLKEKNIDKEFYGSVYLATVNVEQVKFLKEIGFKRVTVEYHMMIDEIKEMCEVEGMDIEVFGNFGGSHLNGRCSLYHNIGEKFDIGFPCKSTYDVISEAPIDRKQNIYDSNLYCSLCNIGELHKAGVDVLKITGRELPPDVMSMIVKTYIDCIKYVEEGMSSIEAKEMAIKDVRSYWSKWCAKKRCKFKENNVTKYYL